MTATAATVGGGGGKPAKLIHHPAGPMLTGRVDPRDLYYSYSNPSDYHNKTQQVPQRDTVRAPAKRALSLSRVGAPWWSPSRGVCPFSGELFASVSARLGAAAAVR